jgi:hypothetical protein
MKLSTLTKNHEAWTGDAALMFMTRVVLVERYPDMPIRCLYSRMQSIVSNKSLTAYCRRHNLLYGCNLLEVEIGKKILTHPEEVKAIILDIVSNDKVCAQLDLEQISAGKINPKFLAMLYKKDRYRLRKQKISDAIRKLPFSKPIKGKICSKIHWLINKITSIDVCGHAHDA